MKYMGQDISNIMVKSAASMSIKHAHLFNNYIEKDVTVQLQRNILIFGQ